MKKMKALEFAIKIENWELVALCLLTGWFEAMRDVPADSIDELMDELAGDDEAPGTGGQALLTGSRQARAFGKAVLRRAEAIPLHHVRPEDWFAHPGGQVEECGPDPSTTLRASGGRMRGRGRGG